MSDPTTHDVPTLPMPGPAAGAAPSGHAPDPEPPPGHGARRRAEERARRRAVERLDAAIGRLSAHLEAATYRLLVMVREMDELEGWHDAGFRSCAGWLSWRTGIGPGAARERVRVARALEDLPVLSGELAAGRLSYSVARALTRVATPRNEAELVATARHSTAAQVERLVRAWRAADRAEDVAAERARHARRELWVAEDGDGSWTVRGRLDPEAGAVLKKALEAAGEALHRREGAEAGEDPTERARPEARRADAMGLLAEAALGEGLAAATEEEEGLSAVVGRAERYQVVVHVSAETLAGGAEAKGAGPPEPSRLPHVQGGPHLAAETARRLACDVGLVGMLHGPEGEVLDVGRKRRTVPPAMRRALDHRDRRCRFPGCGARFCDAHHITPWAEGGETELENLVLLCRRHHRLVHEDGWRVERVEAADGANGAGRGTRGRPRLRFRRPDGRALPAVPAPTPVPADPVGALEHQQRHLGIDADTASTRWDGGRMDLDWALATLGRTAPGEASGPSVTPPVGRIVRGDVSAETPGSRSGRGGPAGRDGDTVRTFPRRRLG